MKLSKTLAVGIAISLTTLSLVACSAQGANTNGEKQNGSSTNSSETPDVKPTISDDAKSLITLIDASLEKATAKGMTETLVIDGAQDSIGVMTSGSSPVFAAYEGLSEAYFTVDNAEPFALTQTKNFLADFTDAKVDTAGDVKSVKLVDADKNTIEFALTLKDGIVTKIEKTFNGTKEFSATMEYSVTSAGQKVLDSASN